MASIQAYPTNTVPKASDLLLGTKVPTPNTEEKPITNNVTVASVAEFANSYSLGYTVYSAQLTAGAGAAPTATVLQNTTGLTFVWSRNGSATGQYLATVAGTPFIANKFWAMVSAKGIEFPSVVRTAGNIARVDNITSTNGTAVNGITEGFIEIRIYS
tara:strand:+ start:712 stop:1185 length:474 start_codon:yes stop_codon:yes gene_type:complete